MTSKPLALITGASAGIGKALCDEFARNGFDLILAARSVDKMRAHATALQGRHGTSVTVIGTDLESPSGPQSLYDSIHQSGRTLSVLVNNAGYGTYGEFKDTPLDATLGMMQVNMNSLVTLTKLFLPDLLSTKGKILNVASTAAFQPGPYMAGYYATKSFVLHFSEALASELARTGVTVTALCPGPTASDFQERSGQHASALVRRGKLASASSVAASGFRAMQRGKTVDIPGIRNKLLAQSVRFAPRSMVTALSHRLNRPV